MKKIVFAPLLILLAAVAFAQGASPKDFSDFEQSLMGDKAASEAPDSASTVDSSSTTDDFEKTLESRPSEREPIYIAREELLERIKRKDSAAIREQIESIDALATRDLNPLSDIEKECAYMEAGMYSDYLELLISHYQTAYDSSKFSRDVKYVLDDKDALGLFVIEKVKGQSSDKNYYYDIKDQIESSGLTDQQKKKIKILVLLRDVYRLQGVADTLKKDAEAYLQQYPDDPDAEWLKNNVYEPVERADLFSFMLKMRKKNKEHVIQEKLYTGGIGLNILVPDIIGISFGMDDLYRSDLFEPSADMINAELYIQISRLALLAEIVSPGIDGFWCYGLGAGFVVYDSRNFKVRPYVGISIPYTQMEIKEDIPQFDYNKGDIEEDSEGDFNAYILGVNLDVKLGTPYLFLSDRKLVTFAVVTKMGLSYVNVDNRFAKGSGVSLFANIGFGVYFW